MVLSKNKANHTPKAIHREEEYKLCSQSRYCSWKEQYFNYVVNNIWLTSYPKHANWKDKLLNLKKKKKSKSKTLTYPIYIKQICD